MFIINWLVAFGKYIEMLGRVFQRPERLRIFFKRYYNEVYQLGIDSIGIVLLISLFIGAVICIQFKMNIQSTWMPSWVPGYATREIMLLEFSSSIMCLILSGKVGSNIASELGAMRVTQQIDALEIMGVNSANFLVLPKIAAFVSYIPVLVVFCMVTSLFGGYLICIVTGMVSVDVYIYGLQTMFTPWYVWYAIIKSLIFAFIISSVSSFFGYYVEGGALQVGTASTRAVVTSSILILLMDVVCTKVMLQ